MYYAFWIFSISTKKCITVQQINRKLWNSTKQIRYTTKLMGKVRHLNKQNKMFWKTRHFELFWHVKVIKRVSIMITPIWLYLCDLWETTITKPYSPFTLTCLMDVMQYKAMHGTSYHKCAIHVYYQINATVRTINAWKSVFHRNMPCIPSQISDPRSSPKRIYANTRQLYVQLITNNKIKSELFSANHDKSRSSESVHKILCLECTQENWTFYFLSQTTVDFNTYHFSHMPFSTLKY